MIVSDENTQEKIANATTDIRVFYTTDFDKSESGQTNNNGVATFEFEIGSGSNPGNFDVTTTVKAAGYNTETDRTTFEVIEEPDTTNGTSGQNNTTGTNNNNGTDTNDNEEGTSGNASQNEDEGTEPTIDQEQPQEQEDLNGDGDGTGNNEGDSGEESNSDEDNNEQNNSNNDGGSDDSDGSEN